MTSPLDSFDDLHVSKTRSGAGTQELLPESQGLVVPVPEKGLDAYTNERLQKSLVYADGFLRQRKTSPRTQHFMAAFKDQIKTAMTTNDGNEKHLATKHVKALEILIENEIFLLPGAAPEAAQYEEKILDLRKIEYYARYGYYLGLVPQQLRNIAKAKKFDNSETLSTVVWWTDVAKVLLEEERDKAKADKSGDYKYETPTLTAVSDACRYLGLNKDVAVWSIKKYGKRNDLLHRSLKEMREAGEYDKLARTLNADLRNISSVFPPSEPEEEIEHLKSVIKSEIKRWFIDSDKKPDLPSAWRASDELEEVFQQAQAKTAKRKEKQSSKEELPEAANPQEIPPEKGKLKKGQHMPEPSSSSSPPELMGTPSSLSVAPGEKRVASTEEPWGSERGEGDIKKSRFEISIQRAQLGKKLEKVLEKMDALNGEDNLLKGHSMDE